MSHNPDLAHDAPNASSSRRRHADAKPRFPPLRRIFRSEPKRKPTGSDDWGADEVGSFCRPGSEEYSWNGRNYSDCIDHRYGVTLEKPEDEYSASDEERKPIAAEDAIHKRGAAMESKCYSGSGDEEGSARRRRKLVREERRILRLREDLLRILWRRQCEEKQRTEMRCGGGGDGGMLWDGVDEKGGGDACDEGSEDWDDEEGGDSDNEEWGDLDDKESEDCYSVEGGDSDDEEGGVSNATHVTASLVLESAERLLVDMGRPRESSANNQHTIPTTNTIGSSSEARESTDEERRPFLKLGARLKTWQRNVKDGVKRHVTQVGSCCRPRFSDKGKESRHRDMVIGGKRIPLVTRIPACIPSLESRRDKNNKR
ncbi:MAG: hypothetical protein FRX48_02986 [Lasallia pustulata]|uniref:Uncharacterized protein n=1 Tax=Lasallia pustulata TaxID=136370 RepID=A0A5M8PUK4_9LECA|nr:MAG: hypothetical protein FRX48_02986 [Lasallia pustulata]